MNIGDKLIALCVIAFCVVTAYLIFVCLPVLLWADIKCLEAGWPKAHVTITLQVYCVNIEGAVKGKVVPVKDVTK